MQKQELNNDMAAPLLEKMTKNTLDGTLTWEMQEVDDNVEIPSSMEVPLTTAHVDYHFQAKLTDRMTAHFQHKNSLYFVWFVDANGGFAYFSGGLYSMPLFVDRIFELSKAIREVTYYDRSILSELEVYLEG